jgi:hypothetical protein
MNRGNIQKISIKPSDIGNIKRSYVKHATPITRSGGVCLNTTNSHIEFHRDSAYLLKDIFFVAYYTIGTPYEGEAIKLKSSLDKLDLLHDIVGVPSMGSWQQNTRFKAKFLQQMLTKHKGHNLVYVDVDAVVHSIPILFKDYTCDIGIRYQDFRWRKNECLSGTIFLANNENVMKVCKEWENINIKESSDKQNLEQWNLGSAISSLHNSLNLKISNMPPEYTFIFDSMKLIYPNINPVIEHFQASRRFKKM